MPTFKPKHNPLVNAQKLVHGGRRIRRAGTKDTPLFGIQFQIFIGRRHVLSSPCILSVVLGQAT